MLEKSERWIQKQELILPASSEEAWLQIDD